MPAKACADCAFLLDAVGIPTSGGRPHRNEPVGRPNTMRARPRSSALPPREITARNAASHRGRAIRIAIYGVFGYAIVHGRGDGRRDVALAFDKAWVSNGLLDKGFLDAANGGAC
jgi:hypothetical protein